MRMDCVIIGAGPAGLTAAWQLAKAGKSAALFEQDGIVGGISRTDQYKGYRFDIGGHRFFTKVELVQKLWVEILDEDFMVRPRLSRIYYDGKFFDYPLKPLNALLGLGPVEAVRIGLSYLWAQAFPHPEERNFQQWVTNRFGSRLFEIFFETYTEKVWGMPCSEINADWAAQRIKNLDLVAAVKNALLGARTNAEGEVITTLIEQFHYPRLGPGQMWETAARRLKDERGVETHLQHRVESLLHDGRRVKSMLVRDASGGLREVTGEHFVSSMPVQTLLRCMDPAPPAEVLAAADQLRYRDYLTVVLIVNQPELFPDNWIYIHSPEVKLGRIQNYKNWSPHMVADAGKTALGLEYFVQEGDAYWRASDAELIELGKRETEKLGLAKARDVEDGCVIRMPKAYPVYDGDYQGALQVIRKWLESLPNLHLIGRNGQHRYNNQDHSMVTACYAAENIVAGHTVRDVWDVNVDAEYHEEVRADAQSGASGDRRVPGRVADEAIDELIRDVFARYDAVALGGAVGVVTGVSLFLATAVLLLRGGAEVGANLSLLGNYLFSYEMSWAGAFFGLFEMSAWGFAFGWLLAKAINFVIAAEEQRIVRRAEERAVDPLEGE
jgi:protoporphyrinogen oxidase